MGGTWNSTCRRAIFLLAAYFVLTLCHPAISFVILLHGLTPRLGVYVMNVCCHTNHMPVPVMLTAYQALSVFKIVILLFIVISGKRFMTRFHTSLNIVAEIQAG